MTIDIRENDTGDDLPLISVALCTYNGEEFLEKQLKSILSQTYKNLEIVIVDDGSFDGTMEIILQYSSADSRIRSFSNTHNMGFNQNFEKAISLSRGEFIAISDQDDIWVEEKIQLLYENIGDNWLIFSNSEMIDSQDQKIGKTLLPGNNFKEFHFKNFLFLNYSTGHTTLFHRDFLTNILPIPKEGFYDWWMGFVAAYHHKITFLNKILTQHRVHNQSVVQMKIMNHTKKGYLDYLVIKQQLKCFKQYKNLQAKDRSFIDRLVRALSMKNVGFSTRYFWIHWINFNLIHPNRKDKGFLSKINFLRKISSRI